MTRRELLSCSGAIAASALLGNRAGAESGQTEADFTFTVREMTVELGPKHMVKTTVYNDLVPGPLVRMTEGKRVTVDLVNETVEPEMLHWHGFHIPPDVDGAHEEGTPMVMGYSRRRFEFTPGPTGTRWYHTHAMAGHNLTKAGYSGQFGMAIIEPKSDPGRYDVEVPIILHEWEGFFSADMDMDVNYRTFTINGKMLGAGEPIRVKASQQVLFRVLNASATMQHRVALSGHTFRVIALDGNAVASPQSVPVLDLAPGERVDAIVEMKNPGIWVLGEEDENQRNSGAGIVVEYSGAQGKPKWLAPPKHTWNYLSFGTDAGHRTEPEVVVPLIIEPRSDGNLWAINGKSYPRTDPFYVRAGEINRLVFDNRSHMGHPVHLHRHTFELTNYAGTPTSGVFKDVVVVPAMSRVEVDLRADQPGPSLFHCHQQFHMDFGFMAVMQYRT